MSGVFQNIHTVGKDFLFDEFTHTDAKTGLILDSCFSLFGNIASLFLIKTSVYAIHFREYACCDVYCLTVFGC